MNKNNLGDLMKHAQQMQDKMHEIQGEIAVLEVIGESGAGLIKIKINGSYNCKQIIIHDDLLKESKEILEDLIAAAFNDAVRRINVLQKQKMAAVSNNMQLPSGFKIPF